MSEQQKNGYVKWPHLVGVIGTILVTIVTITIFGVDKIAANDRIREAGDKELAGQIKSLLENNNSSHERILEKQAKTNEDLASIKAVLGVKK